MSAKNKLEMKQMRRKLREATKSPTPTGNFYTTITTKCKNNKTTYTHLVKTSRKPQLLEPQIFEPFAPTMRVFGI